MNKPISLIQWLEYYRNNAGHMDALDWNMHLTLSPFEAQVISSSIRQFQKGESSEGRNLIEHGMRFPEEGYYETIRLFIREEQRHAQVLGRFMDMNGIGRIKEHWVDNVFRRLRKGVPHERSIVVLLTAEIIAAVYYQALQRATHSKLLKAICRQILSDEEMHINFQSFTLNYYFEKKSALSKWRNSAFHRLLMAGTCGIVWLYHGKVFRAGGFSFLSYWRTVMNEFNRSRRMVADRSQISIRHQIKSNHSRLQTA